MTNQHQPPQWVPSEEEIQLIEAEVEIRRSMAREALKEEIRGEVIIHDDACPWTQGGACVCAWTLLFVSRTRLTSIAADRSQHTVRLH